MALSACQLFCARTARQSFVLWVPALLIFFLQPAHAQQTGCEVCAITDNCARAYHNTPGQYCGLFHEPFSSTNRPCCCPVNTLCKVSADACKCHVPANHPASYGPSAGGGGRYSSSQPVDCGDDPFWFVRLAFVILFLVCCCCFVPACINRGRESSEDTAAEESVPIAVPYTSGSNPPPSAPTWVPGTGYDEMRKPSGGGMMHGLAPALGGLAVGTVIGDLVGRHQQRQDGFFGSGAGYYGAVGGDGGFDIQGDSGGDDFGGDDGGFDVSGDS